jgi:hypothetical protein
MTPSEWARQCILRSLEADGVRLRDGHVEQTADARPKTSGAKTARLIDLDVARVSQSSE